MPPYSCGRKINTGFVIFVILIASSVFILSGGCNRQAKSEAEDTSLSAETDNKYGNRLKGEQSPYLLQHADNPVNWYPWGKEALDRAKKENKPIFLSIGYSTCHWCHVMEHESFEDSQTAELLNRNFISIKVDREERPDLDNIYMQAVVAMTGSGGWPLSVFLTPEVKPFYGGTYFPPDNKYGRPGFKSLLTTVADAWQNKGEEILRATLGIENHLKELAAQAAPREINPEILDSAYQTRLRTYDSDYGGFGSAPKFPMGHNLSYLLHYWHRYDQPQALAMVEQTLKKMAGGGIYDHLGGGFHRYSTDRVWLAPHFEKMLYDQAILSRTYLEAFQATGDEFYAGISREIFAYVLRDMTDSEGGFYSAEDADSEGKEGTFYLWNPAEVKKILGEKDGTQFCRIFDVTDAGNFEGENILHLGNPPEENLSSFISSSKEKLFQARKRRVHPHKDDKILTDWNGLMIGSLAYGYTVLGEPKYLEAAEKAADFILKNLQKKGRLLKHYREKAAEVKGFLDDYAFFVYGLIELYQASFDPRRLKEAVRLTDALLELFGDEEQAGFYFSAKDGEQLISRTKELYDGALPSGNSVAVYNLLRLGKLTMNQKYADRAEAALKSFMGTVAQNPASYSQMLMGIDFYLGPSQEIVIAGEPDQDDTKRMLQNVRKQFLPRKVVILHPAGKDGEKIENLIPYLEGLDQRDQKATAYVCRDFVCQLPTTDLAQLDRLLNRK